MQVYFTITNNCNLECPHCCYEAGPGKPSMNIRDIRRVIDNFSGNIGSLWLSGGEIFTRRKLLYSTLEYIKTKDFKKLKEICVQTNGYWARTEKIVNETLDKLEGFGVTFIHIASNDYYHISEGLDLTRLWRLHDTAKKRSSLEVTMLIRNEYSVFPLGRGRKFEQEDWDRFPQKLCNGLRIPRAEINYQGNVYPCCWMVLGSELGDAREENLEEIIQRSLKNPIVKTLIGMKGPQKLARRVMKKREIKKHLKYGQCNLCIELFRQSLLSLR